MPSRWGADKRCEVCGLRYQDLRTGDTFASIKEEMKAGDAADPTTWRYRRRNSVLGYWHAKKVMWWEYHLGLCYAGVNQAAYAVGGVEALLLPAQEPGREVQDCVRGGHPRGPTPEVGYPDSWDEVADQQPVRRRRAGAGRRAA
jgi:hypothetical protein